MTPALVIGVGNPLRRDDGAGPAVAAIFVDHPLCRVLLTHQLLPEHIEELARHELVAIVDAAVDCDEVRMVEIGDSNAPASLGHVCDPHQLLGLCLQLHGRTPKTFLIKIPAVDFGYWEGFSATTTKGIQAAAKMLELWLKKSATDFGQHSD